jgi:hypothetical protein
MQPTQLTGFGLGATRRTFLRTVVLIGAGASASTNIDPDGILRVSYHSSRCYWTFSCSAWPPTNGNARCAGWKTSAVCALAWGRTMPV